MSTTPIIKHPERINDKWFPMTNTIKVDVTRTATLSGDLSEIVARRFVRIDVTLGSGDARQSLHFNRDEADWLSRALADAVASADRTALTTPADQGDNAAGGGSFREGGCALDPTACDCMCHQPGGMAVSHMVACCMEATP